MTTSILPASLRNIPVQRFIAIVRRGMPKWRRAVRRPRAYPYVAEGGPLDGHELMLTDGTTAVLRIGSQRGRYLCGAVACRSMEGITVWKPMP